MRFFLYIALFLAFFALTAPGLYADSPDPAPVTEEAAAQAWEEAARELRLQTKMPEDTKQPQPVNIEPLYLPTFPAAAAKFLLGAALAALLVIFILKLVDGLRDRRRSDDLTAEGEGAEAEAPGAVAARLDQAHLEAEELAASGQFAKAMHVLLLQSLAEMRRRLGISIAVSLTSREIVARVALGAGTRAALADLVRRVEISYFGEYAAGEAEYLASRQSFELFSRHLKVGGQA